jgi:hypothetical protein
MEAATNVVNPAAGPDTASGEALMDATITPPMIPDKRPAYRGAPDARAIPKHSGNATKKTDRPAARSYRSHMIL